MESLDWNQIHLAPRLYRERFGDWDSDVSKMAADLCMEEQFASDLYEAISNKAPIRWDIYARTLLWRWKCLRTEDDRRYIRDGLAHIANGGGDDLPGWRFFCYWADKTGLTEKYSWSCDLRFLTPYGEELLRDYESLLG